MIMTAQSVFGGVVYGLVCLGLAAFVWMQQSKSEKLLRLQLVAGGLALWGAFFLIATPIDIAQGFVPYGTLYDVIRVVERFLGALGQLGGLALIVVGSTLTAMSLAGVEPDDDAQ